MKKILQTITLGLVVTFLFTTVGFGQALVEQSKKAPAQAEMQSKDAELLWGANWQDPAESTNGIVSTYFGALDPPLVLSADDFMVPEGEAWDITSVWTRGFYSFDADTGEPWAEADAWGFRIYADNGGQPGDMLHEVTFEQYFEEGIIEMDLAEPITLMEGTYWMGTYGIFYGSASSVEGRWNQYMWNPLPEAPMSEPMLRDYADLFGMADDGWFTFSSIGINFSALDFAIWGVQGDPDPDPDPDPDMFTVTFNVNMAGAVAVGDVEFDPDAHRVFLSGTFAEWATPGSDDTFELLPVPPAKGKEEEMLYPGNWDENTEGAYLVWTDGGPIFGTNIYNDLAYGQIFEIDEEYHITSAKYWIAEVLGMTGDVVFTVWDYSMGMVGDVLGTKTIPLADVNPSETMDDAFMVTFDEPIHVAGDFVIGADLSGLDDYQEDVYLLANMCSPNGSGGMAGLAIVLEGASWVPVLNYNVDVDIAVFPFVTTGDPDPDPDPDPEEMIYTLTLEIEGGDQEYKYFLVADEPTWDLGEKEGTDNREVNITADVVFNNTWGDFELSIDPPIVVAQEISLFPNPASSLINVEAGAKINEVRVFDITGRVVLQQEVGNETTTLDVTGLRNGLYIMQVNTVDGTESHRFHVVK